MNYIAVLALLGARDAAANDKSTSEVDAFPVDCAGPNWQYSGVWVKAGHHVEIETTGKWNPGWGEVTSKGYNFDDDPNGDVPFFHPGKEFKNWHWGSLICAVGSKRSDLSDLQNKIEIQGKCSFTTDCDGGIYFLCNDNPNGGYAGNSGRIHVKIVVTDVEANAEVLPSAAASGTNAMPKASGGN